MFGKMKQWFGIEGVKVELELPESVKIRDGVIEGALRFSSMTNQEVEGVRLRLVEKYTRGRKEDRLIDEYTLGESTMKESFKVPASGHIEIDFKLPFELVRSEIDEMQGKNFLLSGIGSLAKVIRKVKSEYRVEAEAKVKGTRLHPFAKATIKLK